MICTKVYYTYLYTDKHCKFVGVKGVYFLSSRTINSTESKKREESYRERRKPLENLSATTFYVIHCQFVWEVVNVFYLVQESVSKPKSSRDNFSSTFLRENAEKVVSSLNTENLV